MTRTIQFLKIETMKKYNYEILLVSLCLTFFFIFFEISLFLQCNQTYFISYTAISQRMTLPTAILPGLIFFLLAQLLLHFIFASFIALLSYSFVRYFKMNNSLFVVIIIWFIWMATLLLANDIYFPNSNFSNLISFFLNEQSSQILFSLLLTLCMLSLIPFLISGLHELIKNNRSAFIITCLVFVFYLLSSHATKTKTKYDSSAQSSESLPNIILIGIDSLRLDHLNTMPFLNSFLQHATRFTESYTPIARTFPAWMSILTGQYPKESGYRTNLMTIHSSSQNHLLTFSLKQKGYRTIYASDEVRFSNIDSALGFDQVITPPMGVNDFLLGTFNDFPLSNLVVNTALGRYLFPYSYANRAVYVTYQPNTFIDKLKNELSDIAQPVFFSIHFCLPHFPYLDAGTSKHKFDFLSRYKNSIVTIDHQLTLFFNLLTSLGWLDKAIVVVFSDHGEALAYAGDRITEAKNYLPKHHVYPNFYPPSMEDEAVNQSTGHGTDVLSLSQYRTLLAFQLFGFMAQAPGEVRGNVSLLDIKPTILDFVSHSDRSSHGLSLKSFIEQKEKNIPMRHILIESDYSPQSIKTVYPEVRKVVMEAIDLFEVDPHTMRLNIKQTLLDKIIKSKQLADIYGHWLVALYPQTDQIYQPILVNLNTGAWTADLTTSFASDSPASDMIDRIKIFYGLKDIKIKQN